MGCPCAFAVITAARLRARGLGRLSRLSVWWMRLGIIPERIALGPPRAKRIARAIPSGAQSARRRDRPRRDARAHNNAAFARFCREYNDERPHESLAGTSRPRPAIARRRGSAGPPAAARVSRPSRSAPRLGDRPVSWRGTVLFLTEALAGEDIAFEEVADGLWTLSFRARSPSAASMNAPDAFSQLR